MEEILKNFDLVPFDVVMIFVGAMSFVLLWKTLEKELFNPFLKLLELREGLTTGADSNAKDIQDEAARLEEDYAQKMLSIRIAAMDKKLAALDRAKAEANSSIDKAAAEAKSFIEKEKASIASSRDKARAEAIGQTKGMVDELVTRLKEPRQAVH